MTSTIAYFLFGLIVWALIAILRSLGIIIPFINGYLTDLYTIPMYGFVVGRLMKMAYKDWRPDLKFVISSTVYITILFEIICPLFSNRFTGDIFDALSYSLGGVIYYLFSISDHKFTAITKHRNNDC